MANKQILKRFVIHNTTVKPKRLDRNGKDTRAISEKKGYIIQFRDENGGTKAVRPPSWGDSNPVITTHLDQGLLDLHTQGLIRIEETEDISSTFGLYSYNNSAAPTPEPAPAAPTPEAPVDLAPPTGEENQPKVNVSQMGDQDYSKEDVAGDHGYPGARNPDGKDNFTVVATGKPKDKKKKKVVS